MGSRFKKVALGCAATGAVCLVAASCGSGPSRTGSGPSHKGSSSPTSSHSSSGGGSKQVTLNMGTSVAGPLSRSFNPFVPTSAGNTYNATTYIYEPLVQFDIVKPGTTYPWLATSYKWSDRDRVLTFDLRHGVTWSDGKPFTSADVVFTFDLLKKYPAINGNGISFTSVKAQGPDTVRMTFAKPAYSQFYYIAGSTYMVPQHVWKGVSNPLKFTDPNPVGTGPFMVSSFSSENMRMVRNPRFWMKGEPKVAALNFTSFSSNTTADSYLRQGKLDWSGFFEPDLKSGYVAKNPAYHYWFPDTGVVSLFPNLTKWPLNQLAVRKAISLALNRKAIDNVGEFGYEPPQNTTGLILPNDKSYLLPQYAHMSTAPNVSAAKKVLEKAGWKLGPNGVFEKGGKPLAFTLVDPSSFTDYMTDNQVIATELKGAGMQVKAQGMSVNGWTSAVADGQFDATVHWSNSGPDPYFVYEGWLDDALTAPVGKAASGDYERWKSPATQALLQQYRNASTAPARKKADQGLETTMVKNLPVIPLMGAADWAEFQTNKVTGWPSASNPYDAASPFIPTDEVVAVHLKPVG